MIIYLIKVQILLLFATLVYMLFFNRETNFSFKRYFILFSVLIAFVLPLLKVPALLSPEISQSIVQQLPVNNTAEADLYIDPRLFDEGEKLSSQDFFLIAYTAVALILLLKFFFQVGSILYFIGKNKYSLRKENGYYIAEINGKLPTFSFSNFVFLNTSDWENEHERLQILTHELEHIKQGHTFDIMLLELASIICWFNPLIYFLKKQTRAIHEYLADAKVLDQTRDSGYAKLLVRSALSSTQLRLANQFHNSLTLKRLNMMKTVKKNISKWKLGMLVPGIALAVFIIACQDQLMAEMEEISKTTTIMSEFPVEFSEDVAKIRAKHPDYILNYIEAEAENREKIASINRGNILHIKVFEKDGAQRIGMIVKYDDNLFNMANMAAPKDEDGTIFLIVEETATPVGGIASFYEFIKKNIQYPAEARRQGIEGKVFVEFIVNTDGSITDVRTVRGIQSECDEEAVRVVSLSPNWNPGKQRGQAIRQRMVLPISFNLSGSDNAVGIIGIEKVMVIEGIIEVDHRTVIENGEKFVIGTVKSAEGKALAGANIVAVGKSYGTVSSIDGYFKLKIEDDASKLAISFIGYKSKEVIF
jgi:TonB family protein